MRKRRSTPQLDGMPPRTVGRSLSRLQPKRGGRLRRVVPRLPSLHGPQLHSRPGWMRFRVPRLTIVSVLLFSASMAGLLVLLNSPLLEIQTIEVEGTEVVSAASVRQLVGLKGEHVLLADLEQARLRVAALPMVRDVAIFRDWPNGIRVAIMERKPWGRWRADNTVWAIDADGVVLEGEAPPFNGPILTQTSALPAIAAGAVVDLTAVQATAELHKRGSPLPLPSVLAYEWSLADGLVVITEHGRIVFGDADGLDYKYGVWELLEREAYERGEPLLFADLRFGLRPSVDIGLNRGRGIRTQDLGFDDQTASANLNERSD